MRKRWTFRTCLLYSLSVFIPIGIWAQESARLSGIEKVLLELVLSDSTSNTVCYLPGGYRFGMTHQPDGHFILLKSGPSIHLLRDGGGKVFSVVNGLRGPEIRRIDSTESVGGSFGCMAFMRKGRIHSYGGYGMWRNIDYFTAFDTSKRDWTPLRATNTLRNEHCFHFYDPTCDRFFVKGSHFREDFESPDNLKSLDSLYRFDFSDSTWKTLGKVEPLNKKETEKLWMTSEPSLITPFGLVQFKMGSIELLVMPENAVYLNTDALFRSYHRIKDRFKANMSYHSVILHLRDTAFFLFGSSDTSVIERVGMTRRDFEAQPFRPIYEPVPTGLSAMLSKTRPYHPLPVGLLLLVLVITLARRWYGKVDGKVRETGWESDRPVKDQGPLVLTGRHEPIPASRFLDTLSVGERDMLKQLLESARIGETMDIESMNKILGVARKEEAVQKTRRSMAVSKINEAFRIGLRREGPLVERVRYENDKRKYRYRIAYEHVGTLDAAMKAEG
jgi:hypothetical protein